VTRLSLKAAVSTESIHSDRAPAKRPMRRMMRGLSRLMLAVLTRTTITGLKNVPASGPLLVLGNHTSTIDPLLLLSFLPETTEFVGPGDFKLLFPGEIIVRWYGLVRVKRTTQLDRASLKRMTDILKSGMMLGLFPDGGTWEKPITDAKSGAAYLSMTTGAPILPVGIGGAYRSWDRIVRLGRPRLTVNIGQVMPPVQPPAEKSERGEALDAATQAIMQRIYELLPTEDRSRYDDLARRRYNVAVDVWRGNVAEMFALPGSAVLGELMLKPNLMSPLVYNAGLPLDPLRYHGVNFPVASVHLAATALQRALHGAFAGYMEYRLGEAKSRDLYAALDTLTALAVTPGVTEITLTPSSRVE
jgi:1-acyl-sn-glycerol-3-phosphate acyltransferase